MIVLQPLLYQFLYALFQNPPKRPTSILAQLHPHHFHHGGNGDVSTLDWSEVPEGILHYEVPHVSGDGGEFLMMF